MTTIRAAVLEGVGGDLEVQELDLAPPRAGEVQVRLLASGVCHSDLNAIDGTAETRCPAVLGHEGAGVVEAVGDGVTRVGVGQHVALSWAPSCGRCAECLDDLPHLCGTAWPMMAQGTLLDGTTRLSRGREPVYHYSFISSSAEQTAERVREASAGGVDVAIEATGRSDAMRAAFLSTRRRGTAVLIGIPAEDAVLELPALSIPRMERRVMGALYGSARPERDFVVILDQYARGRLPIDRLISHRLPLDGIGEAFDLLRSGSGRRVVLDLADQS